MNTQPTKISLTSHNRACLIIASFILCLSHAVSGKDVNLEKLDTRTLVSKMTPLKGTTPAQWRVIWTGDASREATISWTTAEPGEKHIVYYGTESGGDEGKLALSQDSQSNGLYTTQQPKPPKPRKGETAEQAAQRNPNRIAPAYYHHARIKNLKPNTRYYFVLESDGERSREFYFRTAPVEGTDFTLIHGGDSRSGHQARCRMNLRIAEQTTADSNVLAFAHGGDYIVTGSKWEQWRLWLSQHELTTLKDGRVLPIIPTKGNHDGGKIYFEVFDLDIETERWHTTMLGKDVAIVTLDTNSPGGGPQAEWLEAELRRLRPEVRWLLVQYHRPLYPAVKGPAKHAAIFCPLFDKYNVDIALEADGHCMKRTVPIRDGKKDPTGIVYVGEGGLGVGQRKPDQSRWFLKDGGKAGSAHHVMQLDFTPDDMRVRFVLMDGSAWDDYTIKARDISFLSNFEDSQSHGSLNPRHPDPATPAMVTKGEDSPAPMSNGKWHEGASGFGYGDNDDATVLKNMRGAYTRVYLTKRFNLKEKVDPAAKLKLEINYDDAFIAYLNGVEVARSANIQGEHAKAKVKRGHESKSAETFSISNPDKILKAGPNLISVEGHNVNRNSSDFSLEPRLSLNDQALIKSGDKWQFLTGKDPEEKWYASYPDQ